MRFSKPPTTVEEQVQLLKRRGMQIPCNDQATQSIKTIGYYRLSAYWHPYKRGGDFFHSGTTFADILDIYTLDAKLRLLLMEAIGRFEIHVRSSWTEHLVHRYGSHAHLDHRHFSSELRHHEQLLILTAAVDKSNEVFVQHYKKTYDAPDSPPLWASVELMTMGQVSRWISATKYPDLRAAIAQDVGLPSKRVLRGVLQSLSYLRNLCAHHARVWNRRLVKRLPLIKRLRQEMVIEMRGSQNQTSNLIYNSLVVLRHLLDHQDPECTFRVEIRDLVSQLSSAQQKSMGFPSDWLSRATWRD